MNKKRKEGCSQGGKKNILGFPGGKEGGKESTCQDRRYGFDLWSRKIPHAAKQLINPWAPTTEPVLWSPGATTAEAQAP